MANTVLRIQKVNICIRNTAQELFISAISAEKVAAMVGAYTNVHLFCTCAPAGQNESIADLQARQSRPFIGFGHPLATATSAVLVVMALMIRSIRRSPVPESAAHVQQLKLMNSEGGNHGLAKRDLTIF